MKNTVTITQTEFLEVANKVMANMTRRATKNSSRLLAL